MSKTFVYSRVSTIEHEPLNQLDEIKAAGFSVEPHCIITEIVSGSLAIAQRSLFLGLIDKMEQGDILIVTKLGPVAL